MVRRKKYDYYDDMRVSDKNFERGDNYVENYPMVEIFPIDERTLFEKEADLYYDGEISDIEVLTAAEKIRSKARHKQNI